MEKINFGLDLDDTTCDTAPRIVDFARSNLIIVSQDEEHLLSRRLKKEDHPDLYEVRQSFLTDPNQLLQIELLSGALEAVTKLAPFFRIYIISGRLPELREATLTWLINVGLDPFIDDLKLRPREIDHAPFKLEQASALGIKFAADDDLEIANQYARNNIFTGVIHRRGDPLVSDAPFIHVFPSLLKMANSLREFDDPNHFIEVHNRDYLS